MTRRKVAGTFDWQRQILEDRIRERGLVPGDYEFFFVTGEGTLWPMRSAPAGVPSEFEEASGYLVDRKGRIFSFWLGWDEAGGVPELTDWDEVMPEPNWADEKEYIDARRAVGLAAA